MSNYNALHTQSDGTSMHRRTLDASPAELISWHQSRIGRLVIVATSLQLPPFEFSDMAVLSHTELLLEPNNGRDESSHAVTNPTLFTIGERLCRYSLLNSYSSVPDISHYS